MQGERAALRAARPASALDGCPMCGGPALWHSHSHVAVADTKGFCPTKSKTNLFGEKAYSDKWQPLIKKKNRIKTLSFPAGVVEQLVATEGHELS